MKNRLDRFHELTWDDLKLWTGDKILTRGRTYRKRGRVSDLATTDEGSLIALVRGTESYATKVELTEDGRPYSICSCPYGVNCKHGVAVVLEYLECVKNELPVRGATGEHPFYTPPDDEDLHDVSDEKEIAEPRRSVRKTAAFLEGKTKKELIGLIHELAAHHPQVRDGLAERRRLVSGEIKSVVKRLRRDIRKIGAEQGWQNRWNNEGFTPDYSGVRSKIDILLNAGYADEVLDLGEELLRVGGRQVEESHDEGETGMEVASCMPGIVQALEQSSLSTEDKLAWAVDAVIGDDYDVCGDFGEYICEEHDQAAWSALADRLLARLEAMKPAENRDRFADRHGRDRLTDWIIYAMERSGRDEEIVPLCESEANNTHSYTRLVKELIDRRRYDDAERWIQEGIRATEGKWEGITARLRGDLAKIRTHQKNWSTVAAIKVEEFVRRPSSGSFDFCREAAEKVKAWPGVRDGMLSYLESGELPWKRRDWPLQNSGLEPPEAARPGSFPMIDTLISISIHEKKPDRVLYWYDKRLRKGSLWYAPNEDSIAAAIATHAPERAVGIWQKVAEGSIGHVNVGAYHSAADYLRKAATVMIREKKQKEWEAYLLQLREKHRRKRRLLEILDDMDGTPIVKKKE